MINRQLLFFLFTLLAWLCVSQSSRAQTCTPIYHKTYNGPGDDEGLDIDITFDKGSIVAGRTTTNSPSWDGFLMRLDQAGNIVWAKSYGGSDYDELVKVKETSDGGYIALGKTKSFGLNVGEAWVIKTDANGTLQWSKHYSRNGQLVRPKHIFELVGGGGYAFAFNTNDSTAQGDGVIVRTDASGNVIWSKVFDNGNDDGINYLAQDNDNLLVGGYATVNDREGILMRISLSNGSIIWSKRFARAIALHDEIVQVEKTSQGLSFSASSTWLKSDRNGYNPCFVTLFRTNGDHSISTQRRIDMFTASYTVAENVTILCSDSNFVYVVNDTTSLGWPRFGSINSAGFSEWGRSNDFSNGNRRLKGLDFFDDKGYVFTGYYSDISTGNRKRIQVLKTDITGRTGSCTQTIAAEGTDTTNYDIDSFSWSNLGSGIAVEAVTPSTSPLAYSVNTLCSDNYCADLDPQHSPNCYATFSSHIQGNGDYSFTPYDVEKVNDGYVVFGYNRLTVNIQPMMVKLRTDGSVLWSKTLTEWMHSGYFDQVLTLNDGNLLVKGRYIITAGNGGALGTLLLKVTPNGNVLWSEDVSREVYDIIQTEDGGFVGTTSTPYGLPPIYITLFKMDMNGKITWQKQINDFQESAPIYQKILYDGTYFYVAGEFYGAQRIAVEKLDTAGNHIWKRVFTIDGFYSTVEGMHMIGDTLYTTVYHYDNSEISYLAKKLLSVVKVSKDGEGLNAFRLSDLNFAPDSRTYQFLNPQMRTVAQTFDNNFIVADRVPNVNDSSVVITKFTPAGEVRWSKRYDQLTDQSITRVKDDNGSLLFLGRKFVGSVDQTIQHETLLMRTDNNGIVSQFGTAYCHFIENTVTSSPVRVEEFSYYPPIHAVAGIMFTKEFAPIEQHFLMTSAPSCATVGNCYSVKIGGLNTVCSIADTVIYTIKRNPGCTISPVWKYDPSAVTVAKQTDSTLSVLFKRGGRTTLSATISSGCGAVSDTISISVPSAVGILNLGNDTTICVGTTILLNAHKGYLNYMWQDGSTDSICRVMQQGKYYVTTTDSCGKVFSDTILVVPHPPIQFSVGADRIKCNNDTVHIDAPSGFMNYSWLPSYNVSSTSAQSVVVNPTKDTSYFVKAEQTPGCFAYDTIRVQVNHSPSINLGNDTSFCYGKSVILDAGPGFNQYHWSHGPSSQTVSVNKPGTYSVNGTTVEGCNSFDTLKVNSVWPLPSPSLDHNTELCQSSTRLLDPGSFSSYLWHDGSTSRKYVVSSTGNYFVQVTDNNGCINGDTVYITTILPSPSDFLPGDTSICSYGTADLSSVRSFVSYAWSNGSTSPKLIVDKAGKYWLQVRDSKGCIGADTIVVSTKDCMIGLRVPNAFTPNHDATNDIFRALLFGNVRSFELTIYNRWGQTVFYTVDRYKGWDGTVGGKDQDPGVFLWMCKYQLEGDKEKIERGTITLIR